MFHAMSFVLQMMHFQAILTPTSFSHFRLARTSLIGSNPKHFDTLTGRWFPSTTK
jgi:hypothetical protein